jgi:hypothetical protein
MKGKDMGKNKEVKNMSINEASEYWMNTILKSAMMFER